MNTGRYQQKPYDPKFTERNPQEEDPSQHSKHKKVFLKLGSYRVEILIELFLIFACMALGVAFQMKIMLTISLFCIAVAIPDVVTGWLVRRDDPDPKHGKALMYFFIASGLLRTASLGVGVFISCMLAFMFFPFAGGMADVGAITGLLVTMCVFVVVFPVTAIGVMHGLKLPGGVFFCRELTKLRRRSDASDFNVEALNPAGSLRVLAAGSAISAAVFSMASVFIAVALLNPGNQANEVTQLVMIAIVLAQLVIPLTWYIFFCVKFVDPWQPSNATAPQPVDPLRPDEFQVLNESV